MTLWVLVTLGCVPISPVPEPEFKTLPQVKFSPDQITATIITDTQFTGVDSLVSIIRSPLSPEIIVNWFSPTSDESLKVLMNPILKTTAPFNKSPYIFDHVEMTDNSREFHFIADTAAFRAEFHRLIATFDSLKPIEPLFQRNGQVPEVFPVPSKLLVLPCSNIPVPRRATRLPNAPRDYRYGVHRGIDFFSNWGTPVRSVAKGVVIRADQNFREVPPNFREILLEQAQRLNRTPSDIFNSVLLGRAVFIDHGFDLFPGYRTITIYAHLSHIETKFKPGYVIGAGEVFGRTGNSGTRESTLGTRNAAHLHWELILQDAGGEYYYGQGKPYKVFYPGINALFE